MVMVTLQWKRASGQDGWNQHPPEAWPGPKKELLVSAPCLPAFLRPNEHRRPSSIQGENCKMEDKNSKGHLRGKPTLPISKLCSELLSSPLSTPTLSPS